MDYVKDAASFLLAIKESTTAVYDHDAVDYLQKVVDELRHGLDQFGLTQPSHQKAREEWIFFEGMLKGVQLKLRRTAYDATQADLPTPQAN